MLRHWIPLSALTALLLLGAHPACALDAWLPVSPADLKMTTYAPAPGAAAIFLYRSESFNEPRGFDTYYERIKILAPAGIELANIQVLYLKNLSYLNGLKGRTIHADGTVIPFDGKSHDQTIVRAYGITEQVRAFSLPQVEVGSIIEYKYTITADRFNQPLADAWEVQAALPVREADFEYVPFDFSKSDPPYMFYSAMWVAHLPPGSPKVKADPTGIRLHITNVPALEEEPLMVPSDELRYQVRFFFGNRLETAADTWKAIGAEWLKTNYAFNGNSKIVADRARELTAGIADPRAQAVKLYAEVQHYENLDWGNTPTLQAAEKIKPPETAGEVVQQRRGYSDQLRDTYVALARAAGLNVVIAAAADRQYRFFNRAVPDFSQLPRQIAVLRLNGIDVYLDPGNPHAPFGALDWRSTGTVGMRENAAGGVEFFNTPAPDFKVNTVQHSGTLTITANGDLDGEISVQLIGQQALDRRQAALQSDAAKRDSDWLAELRSELPPGAEATLRGSTGWDNDEGPLSAVLDVKIAGYAAQVGDKMALSAGLFQSSEKQPFTSTERHQPIYFPYPYTVYDDVRIVLPAGASLGALPAPVAEGTGFAAMNLSWTAIPAGFEFRRRFELSAVLLDVHAYPDLQNVFGALVRADRTSLLFQLPAVAAGGGH